MEVRFYGVRGSIAVSGAHAARIGGNTSCLEVVSQGHRLILDAGTGIRALGEAMMREGDPRKATLFFSHLHWDHVQGFPFFTPAYLASTELTMYGPGANGDQALQSVLSKQMEPPNFPVPLSTMRSRMKFDEALHGRTVEVGPEARFVITQDASGVVLEVSRGLVLSRVPETPEEGPRVMHAAMMAEPHAPGLWNHIGNILNSGYRRIGVGLVTAPSGVQYLSETFAD